MKSLVKRAQRGDNQAFVELIEENKQAMYKVAVAILKNDFDAADAIQESILTCYEKLRELKKAQFFKTWLLRILINNCNQMLREQKKVVEIEDYYGAEDAKGKKAEEKIADNSESVQNPRSEAESNGVTVTVSDAYCDGYEMYFTMTATTDNDQVNQKDYLLPEKSQRVYVSGEETAAELSLEKAEDGSFVGLGHISAGWLADKTFKDQSTVGIKFTGLYAKVDNQPEPTTYVEGENLITGQWNLEFTVDTDTSLLNTYEVNTENNGFTVSKIVKVPASTYLYLEVPEEYENVQMILTDADGNKLEKFGGTTTDPENGMYEIQLQFEQTDTNQIHIQVIDMDQSTNDNLVMVAEMTADLN